VVNNIEKGKLPAKEWTSLWQWIPVLLLLAIERKT